MTPKSRAASVTRTPSGRAVSLGATDEDEDRLELRTNDPYRLADELASYGADVVVEHPAEVRAAVIERLTRLAAISA